VLGTSIIKIEIGFEQVLLSFQSSTQAAQLVLVLRRTLNKCPVNEIQDTAYCVETVVL